MSEKNGDKVEVDADGDRVVKIGKMGRMKLCLGDITVRIDCIGASDAYYDLDNGFRGDDGKVPREKLKDYTVAAFNFVKDMLLGACAAADRPKAEKYVGQMSLAEARKVITEINKESLRLQHFFKVDTQDEPSSPESTEVTFST